jgi:serine/threonine protein kinase
VENQHLVFPETISDLAKDFIDKLVRKDPNERIKANQALEHPFLKNVNLN